MNCLSDDSHALTLNTLNVTNLDEYKTIINTYERKDILTSLNTLSIALDNKGMFFHNKNELQVKEFFRSGLVTLEQKLGISQRLINSLNNITAVNIINNVITDRSQDITYNNNILIRLYNDKIRAIVSPSYTKLDDDIVIKILEDSVLNQILNLNYSSVPANSTYIMNKRGLDTLICNLHTIDMTLYILNNEIGDASVRCQLGIRIHYGENETIHIKFSDNRLLNRTIHRGDVKDNLKNNIVNLFEKADQNWELIKHTLIQVSSMSSDELITLEEKMIETLKIMPEFDKWKEEYLTKKLTYNNTTFFDILYLMTSIKHEPYYMDNLWTKILYKGNLL